MHWRRKWQLTPVFLPGESQGWGSLVGCRLWGHTESDTTEALSSILSLPLDSDGPSQGWTDKDHVHISLTSMCHLSIYYYVLIMPGS